MRSLALYGSRFRSGRDGSSLRHGMSLGWCVGHVGIGFNPNQRPGQCFQRRDQRQRFPKPPLLHRHRAGEYPGDNPGHLVYNGGVLDGMPRQGGANNDGTVFSLTTPKPSTFALLGVGFVSFVAYGWRKRAARRTAPDRKQEMTARRSWLSIAVISSDRQDTTGGCVV